MAETNSSLPNVGVSGSPHIPIQDNTPPSHQGVETSAGRTGGNVASALAAPSDGALRPGLVAAAADSIARFRTNAQTALQSSEPFVRPSQLPVLRVSQLDAESLETDLTTLLGYQLKTMFKFFDTDVVGAHKANIEALLRAFLFRYTIMVDKASPGLALQNLMYRSVRDPPAHRIVQQLRQAGGLVASSTGSAVSILLQYLGMSSLASSVTAAMSASVSKPAAAAATSGGLSQSPSATISSFSASRASDSSSASASLTSISSLDARALLRAEVGASLGQPALLPLPAQTTQTTSDRIFSSIILPATPSLSPTALSSQSTTTTTTAKAPLHSFSNSSNSTPMSTTRFLSPAQKVFYFLFQVVFRWGWARLLQKMSEESWFDQPAGSWRKRLYEWTLKAELSMRVVYLVNFFVFMLEGKYMSPIDRILGIRLVYQRSRISRLIAFDLLHQQLFWNGILDFCFFLAPLVDTARISRFLSRILYLGTSSSSSSSSSSSYLLGLFGGGSGAAGGGGGDGSGLLDGSDPASSGGHALGALGQYSVSDACPVCKSVPITQAHVANCGHVFCYYCLRGSRLAQPEGYSCPICFETITSQKPLAPP